MSYKEGEKVKHKLTGETMLVLSHEGYGIGYVPRTRVRTKDLEERWFDTAELEAEG